MEKQNIDVIEKMKELQEAKQNTLYCLNNPNGLAGMHGLAFWAERVEKLREEILKLI